MIWLDGNGLQQTDREIPMYKRILVPTDGSDTATAGLLEACKLAQELKGAQLRVIHVVDAVLTIAPELGIAYDTIVESLVKGGASILTRAESIARERGLSIETELLQSTGTPAGELVLKAAKEWPADVIVCGTHGRRGLRRIVMGSDAEYIVRNTPVPVLLIRKDGR
jgi:nucleotide-binding universal stress UspA family protein